MFGPKLGTWYLSSKSDPRWNIRGKAFVGGFAMCSECLLALNDFKRQYGAPPEDLEHGYMKD